MLGYPAITSQEEWQTESPVPYKIREDLHKSPRKTASICFLKKQSLEAASMPSTIGQMVTAVSANPEAELISETLQQG